MNRRTFHRAVTGALAAMAAPLPASSAAPGAGKGGQSPQPGTVTFQLSVMLWTVFRNLPFEQRLEKVTEAGYHNVELVGEYRKWTAQEFASADRKRRELGITFDTTAGLAHAVGDPAAREAFLKDLRNELPIMEKLECPAVIVMSGNVVPGMPREQQHASCIEGLKRAAEVVEGKNVRLLLENIDPKENPRYYLQSVAEGFEIIKSVGHPQVRFLYDFYHEQIAEGNLIDKLEKNIDLVGLVHIADVPGRHEPGTGEINYGNIFKKLAELKFSHYAAMEYLPTYDAVKSLQTEREKALMAAQTGLS